MGMTERLHNAACLNCLHKNYLHLKSLCNHRRVAEEVQVLQCVEIGPGVGRPVGSRSCSPDLRVLEEILKESAKFNLQHSVHHYQASRALG